MSMQTIEHQVHTALAAQPITDLHTHVYSPRFGASPKPGSLLLWGVDELVTYHYLVAEVYRVVPASQLPLDRFWAMPKSEQADHIWRHLFVERTPLSEACRGVLTSLSALGLDPNERTLGPYRRWFAQQDPDRYVDRVMSLAHVDTIVMTNPVFDDHERGLWESDEKLNSDPRFSAVLRIDPLLRDWPAAAARLRGWGYEVRGDFGGDTVEEARRFLRFWLDRMRAIYVACSLPPEFRYPAAPAPAAASGARAGASASRRSVKSVAGAPADRVFREVLMPVLAERGMPMALMIGSRLRVNPALNDAGDMVGHADVASVVNLCRDFPDNKFLVTMLARENQHELCVAARKFGNLMLFGCWWFLNNPSLIDEITRMRLELLGTSFIPQHSDARILDQLIYKWDHNRRLIARVLIDKYHDLAATGRLVSHAMIKRDVALLLRENFWEFLAR